MRTLGVELGIGVSSEHSFRVDPEIAAVVTVKTKYGAILWTCFRLLLFVSLLFSSSSYALPSNQYKKYGVCLRPRME